jgi:glutathione S-transferase
MKIYEASTAPNARRVRIFLAEKAMLDQVEFVQVDLQAGGNISAEFRQKNPLAKIPVMELDNDTFISESMAICRYFEALNPSKPLMGVTPLEQAEIEMWQRRCEISFMNIVGMGFQHSTGYFADRMTPVKEWGDVCIKDSIKFMSLLDAQLADNTYVAGESFSVADITAFVAMDFARVIRVKADESLLNLHRWYDLINARESSKA